MMRLRIAFAVPVVSTIGLSNVRKGRPSPHERTMIGALDETLTLTVS